MSSLSQALFIVRVVSGSLLAASLLLFTLTTHAAPTTPIGATSGSFSVDANGGANYSIPIAIPPGTAGMAPSVSISYSAQIDSGILLRLAFGCARSTPALYNTG